VEILGSIALVLLIVAGYSTGSVIAGKGKKVAPSLLDILIVAISWIIAFSVRFTASKWITLLFWIPFEICAGAFLTWLRIGQYDLGKAEPAAYPSTKPLAKLWHGWKQFANRLGNYSSRIWLAFIYFILMIPFGLLMRLFINPWKSSQTRGTAWIPKESAKTDLSSARNQF
jgi:hypothetical protein